MFPRQKKRSGRTESSPAGSDERHLLDGLRLDLVACPIHDVMHELTVCRYYYLKPIFEVLFSRMVLAIKLINSFSDFWRDACPAPFLEFCGLPCSKLPILMHSAALQKNMSRGSP